MRCICGALAALLCMGASASAQDAEDLQGFLEDLAVTSERFQDVNDAIAEGYRKLGPDFPGMGEHWIHPGLVIAGELDARRPPVLGYTRVGDERRLVALGYTRVLGPDESPPDGPFPEHAWHDHTGGVDEESLLLAGPASTHPTGEGFRLAMVHVWLDVENPDGRLAQNNWALPFVRVGVEGPSGPTSRSARALALSFDEGVEFYRLLLDQGLDLEEGELATAVTAFDAAAARAEEVRKRMEAVGRAGDEDVRSLEDVWRRLWDALDATLTAESLEAMEILRS